MSEYQYIDFLAVDRPLVDAELRFAERQSTRAKITRWSFTNEYHFGDFRGDVEALLRSGYDVHLHYANYGVRRIAFRLPRGMPFPDAVWKAYIGTEGFTWKADKNGEGGILSWQPFHDADSIDEFYELEGHINECVGLRQRLILGDLRALYVIWLCTAGGDYADPDAVEPPVPLGLNRFTEVAGPVLNFFGIDPLMLIATAEGTPPLPETYGADVTASVESWIDGLDKAELRQRLVEVLTDDAAAVKAKLLAEFRDQSEIVNWPTVPGTRTFNNLRDRGEMLRERKRAQEQAKREKKARREAEVAERERQKRMAQMTAEPEHWLDEAARLAAARGTVNYKAAADILADLREAIGGKEGQAMAREKATELAKKHPTLTQLKGSLRKRGLLD